MSQNLNPNSMDSAYKTLEKILRRLNLITLEATAQVLTAPEADFDGSEYQTLELSGDVTFTAKNHAEALAIAVRIIADGSDRALAFPAGWKFIGEAAPTSIAAGKTAILSLTSFGTTDADVIAAYAVEL